MGSWTPASSTTQCAAPISTSWCASSTGCARLASGMRSWRCATAARGAHETGRQLWPAVSHATYRLALEAPAPYAAAVLDHEASFSLGPLPEVVAQSHPWHDLAPHMPIGPSAVLAAHERVLRGEDLSGIELPGPAVLEVPLRLVEWEPRYALAEYRSDRADFPMPDIPCSSPRRCRRPRPRSSATKRVTRSSSSCARGPKGPTGVPTPCRCAATPSTRSRRSDRATCASRRSSLRTRWPSWRGPARAAVRTVDARVPRPDGSAPGMRLARLTDLLDEWPPDPALLGAELARLELFAWDGDGPKTGWRLHVAVTDRARVAAGP